MNKGIAVTFVLNFILHFALARDFNVLDFGAKADGINLDTKAVQAAIDLCNQEGGGTVVIPSGKKVLIGTIILKDFVTLHLENGSVLMGSPNIDDYLRDTHKNMYKNEPHMDRCLIFARDARSVAIEGYGTIDGNGVPEHFTNKTGRPMLLRFLNCTDLHLRDVTLVRPASWTSAWLYCTRITVSGIRIHSRANHNGDGLDFDGCTDVRVMNSSFDTSDDSICLQASLPDRPCQNVTISNCTFESKWAGIRIGLLSRGDFNAVTVTNCTFSQISDSGLKIQMNEGGTMRNMVFSNLVMKNVPRPIFLTFAQQRACVDAPDEMYPMASMGDFIFENFAVDNSELDKNTVFFISGLPDHYVDRIILRNILLTCAGGGHADDARRAMPPEYTLEVLDGWWPEFHLLGTLPAHAIYARHVAGLSLDNVQIKTIKEDHRPAIVFDDVLYSQVSNCTTNNQRISSTAIKP